MLEFYDGFYSLWPGSRMRVCILPPTISKMLLMYIAHNFAIISNLFHSTKPYAFCPYIENVRTKCIIFGKALRIRVKKFKQNLPENYSKSTKITITACKFSKIFRESIPPDFSRLKSLFCVSISFTSVLPKKIRLKKVWKFLPPTPFKISRFATE